MDRVIEELRKNAEPVAPQCLGQDIIDSMGTLIAPRCSRIDPLPVYEIIDEETGQVDEEAAPTFTVEDEACRCTAYFRPKALWNRGRCPLADHVQSEEDRAAAGKVRVGQQKQKKK